MVELNNINALTRIYSRMISCAFLVMSCMACFLFPSLRGAVMQPFFIGVVILLFMTYQDKQTSGMTYYAFVLFGIASMAVVHILFFLPILWVLMFAQLQSLSWRTWSASLLGLLTPYWFAVIWFLWQGDVMSLINHFSPLMVFSPIGNVTQLPFQHLLVVATTLILFMIGTIHFIRKHSDDKIRIRQFYYFFIWMTLVTMVFLVLQPQHYDALMRLLFVFTAPLLGHFLALTSTKMTNVAFFVIIIGILLLTGYNLWAFSSIS